jgi:hypothetical protein
MAFLNDTIISFLYPYKVEQKPLLAWTFDNLQDKPNTPKKIAADYHLLDTVSEAVLYCNGTYGSSDFVCASSNTELGALNGSTIGDPRPKPYAGKAIAFMHTNANEKSVVLKFPTKGYFNLALSIAVQRTPTGFNKHEWEWSLDGENYTFIEDVTTCPLTTGEFVLTTLDLRTIDELDDQEAVFLRITFDGCTSSSGNNRLDNITLHGVAIHGNSIDAQKKSSNVFLIAPNPTQGQFQIIFDDALHSNDINFFIYNSLGQKIRSGKLENPQIDLAQQPSGIYYCKILDACIKIAKY